MSVLSFFVLLLLTIHLKNITDLEIHLQVKCLKSRYRMVTTDSYKNDKQKKLLCYVLKQKLT